MEHKVEILEQRETKAGFLKIGHYMLRHSLFAGGWSDEIKRDRLQGLGATSVLLYDPELDRVALMEQFRIGALESGKNAWLYETVAGHIGHGEKPEEVAHRESLEEAGCELKALIPICDFWVSPGISDERISLFCGVVDSEGLGGIHGLDEEGEDIRVVVMPAQDAIGELYGGRADSTSIIIALQWLAMNRERLQSRDY